MLGGSEHASQNIILVSKRKKKVLLTDPIKDYISEGEVTGRGCSTKDKIFHIECENHVMGRTSRTTESFCYCSFAFCNSNSYYIAHNKIYWITFIALIYNNTVMIL